MDSDTMGGWHGSRTPRRRGRSALAGRAAALVLGVLALAPPTPGQGLPPELAETARRGLAAREQGRYDEAAKAFEELVEAAPELAPAHLNLGLTRHEQGEYAMAAGAFERALELAPDLPGVRPLLGYDLVRCGRYEDAIPVLRQAQEEAAQSDRVEPALGLAYLRTGRTDEAIEVLNAVRDRSGDTPDLLRWLAEAHSRRAAELGGELLATAPKSSSALLIRAEQAAADGAFADAAELYTRVLQADPSRIGVRVPLGDLFFESEDYEGALELYNEEARRAPTFAKAFERSGEALLRLGRGAEAVEKLARAAELDPESSTTAELLGKAYADVEDWAQAEGIFLRLLAHGPTAEVAARIQYQLAQIYRKTGRREEAARRLTEYERLRAGR